MDTHKDAPPTNTMAGKFQGAIYLGITKNFQVSCNLIILRTGLIITRNKFTPLLVQQFVINQVEDMSIKEDCDEYIIFAEINRSTLEVYNDDVNTDDVTAGVDNNYNNYNNNNTAYEDGSNNEEHGHEYGTIYTENSPKIMNKRRWIITLEKRHQEWEPPKKQKYWMR